MTLFEYRYTGIVYLNEIQVDKYFMRKTVQYFFIH